VNLLGWWAPWLGVAVVAVGTYLYWSPPERAFWWLLVVLYVAWIGQFLGGEAFGGYVGGFLGALVLTPVATPSSAAPPGRRRSSPSSPPSGCWYRAHSG
jgi:uncharacterized membrane protein YjjB (DUF3815 family)